MRWVFLSVRYVLKTSIEAKHNENFGFIAQELETIMPNLVKIRPDDKGKSRGIFFSPTHGTQTGASC